MEDKKKLQAWIERIRKTEEYVIVEGKNDKESLIRLGLEKERVITFGMPAYKLAELIAGKKAKKVIILTDLDKEGKKIYAKLKENLNRLGIQEDRYFRETLSKESRLSHIEGAYNYFRRLGLSE